MQFDSRRFSTLAVVQFAQVHLVGYDYTVLQWIIAGVLISE